MLEIGDGLVDYFLPYDARECLAKMEFYLADQRYDYMNKRVSAEYTVYTWDKSYDAFQQAVTQS
ncbi:hypothetical protein B7Z00_05130 [Candidatus Saccharibacteria bacterium 32-50-10]|nr:MAG: hypothetical protein B7Z00_05130 [Candidatus Saccharibacteria bacterium 32-50-10]